MRPHRGASQAASARRRAAPPVAIGNIAVRIAEPGAPNARTRAAWLGGVSLGALALLVAGNAYAVDGTWTAPAPGPAEWTTGTNWSSAPSVPDNTATFTNNGAAPSVTISNSASINTIQFTAAAPAYSFTVQNGATFTIGNSLSSVSAFSVNSGATLAIGDTGFVEIGSLANGTSGGGTVQIGTSDASTALSIAGSANTTFSGAFAGVGSLSLDGTGMLTLTGASNGGNIGTIGGDLDLCSCDTGGLTISGGTLTVNSLSTGVMVEGGTLAVINGGKLQIGPGAQPDQPDHRLARRRRRRDLGRGDADHRQRQHQHDLLRRDLRHRRPDQDRHRHAAAHRDQHLYRCHHRQRGQAVGERLDRQFHVTVNAGGMLGGTGVIGSTTINGGTLSPGNSIGTLTVQGNLVLTSASAYLVEVSPTAADRTNVTGTASLAGTVQAVFGPGSSFARTYTILSAAGGLGGTRFNSLITGNLPVNFATSLSYTPTDVLLNLTAVLGADIGLSQNQRNVAGALNGFFNNGGTLPPGFRQRIRPHRRQSRPMRLSQLSGEAATGGQQVAFQMTNQFLGLMIDPFVDGRSGVR